jgi:hypothetical protein
MASDPYVHGPEGNDVSLIDWGVGKDFPSDSDLKSLGIVDQIKLLQKAWREQYAFS